MLHDLEELVLKCRNERAKAYIGEAVGCYRASSYRSAIVATWIAVAFDIIDKIRELSLAGDKEAENLTAEFEAIRRTHDLVRSLAFERRLLTIARDNFELISPLEYRDLERIQEDRHRCAHPSHTSDSEIFSPSAELARLHIRSAIEILLMHEPAQGKAALDGLLKEIASPYFPDNQADALKVLEKGPLRRARPSLARNFLIVLVKSMIEEDELKHFWRQKAAFRCAKDLQPAVWRNAFAEALTRLFRPLASNDELTRGCDILLCDVELWSFLDAGQQTKIKTFVKDLPTDGITDLEELLEYAPLMDAAKTRAAKMTLKDFAHPYAIFFTMPETVCDRLIAGYAESDSFEDANSWGKVVTANAGDLSKAQMQRVVEAAGKNGQIAGSFGLAGVFQSLRKTGKYSPAAFNALLVANDLKDHVVKA